MSILNKLFGSHKSQVEEVNSDAKPKEIIAKVNELVAMVNSVAKHLGETAVSAVSGQADGKIDLASSKDPAHLAAASDDFKKLQEGSLQTVHPVGFGAPANPNQPTQQNVPSPNPGAEVPTPSEYAEAQQKVAKDQENGDHSNVTQAQADILNHDK